MSSDPRVEMKLVAALAVCTVLAACGNLSDVGDQENKPPTAVAEVPGYSAPTATGDVTTEVRALSQVLLTGKDSDEADKPIISFLWEPISAPGAVLTVRNSSTVAVQLPAVSLATDMQFRLTVTDSDGDEDTATVTLKVQPALDPDRFLKYVGGDGPLQVVAATRQPAAASAQFQLEVQARVTYTTRSGDRRSVSYRVGDVFSGVWLANPVPAADGQEADLRNPHVQFTFPHLDVDAITRQFQLTLPGSAPSLPDPAFIDDADMELVLTLTPGAGAASTTLYVLDRSGAVFAQQSNAGSGAPVTLELTAAQVEDLRLASGDLENKATARSYYDAIDPDHEKLTLTQWLTANCFNATARGYGADAHAVYVNNFDLGFGRDMYFRTAKPAGCSSASFGAADAASVVINYPTLEAAAKKILPSSPWPWNTRRQMPRAARRGSSPSRCLRRMKARVKCAEC